MKLYHGTSESKARLILQGGLKPRNAAAPNFPNLESYPDMVYLTKYAAASYAWEISRRGNERWAIIEIDNDQLDENAFYPDQVYLSDKYLYEDSTPKEIRAFMAKIDEYRCLWQNCLETHHNVAYKGIISPDCITRVVVYDATQNSPNFIPVLTHPKLGFEPPHIIRRFKAGLKWLFGEKVKLKDFLIPNQPIPIGFDIALMQDLSNRNGIELIYEKK